MAKIIKLRKQRGTIKSKMTRLKNKIEQLEKHRVSREETEVYLARLEKIQRKFEIVQHEITSVTEDEDSVMDVTNFEKKYLELKIKVRRWYNMPSQQDESRITASNFGASVAAAGRTYAAIESAARCNANNNRQCRCHH